MEQHSFGYWLRLKRKALDLTREALAERIGYSAATIRKIEDEERHPSTQIVERLIEIFDIPSSERADFLRFARGDWKSAPDKSIETPPWRASTNSPRSNLPATVTSLVGRVKEITDVRQYLLRVEVRLLALIGPPGIGKTRLSLEAAHALLPDFPDGVFFVALAVLDDSSLILRAIFQALGYVEAANLPAEKQLAEGIGDKQMLIVLDNCEHLIENVAPLASGLLSACPRLKILVTSREALRIPGEWLYSVPTLNVPKESSSISLETISEFPALTLFSERAHAVRSDFELNAGNIQAVASICSQLDGLPLAIELIAPRIRLMSPESLLNRLTNQFILSADGVRAVSPRQKTLNNAIGWSYNFLSLEEQKLFAYLSVFSGGFTLEAAESVFSGMFTEKSVIDLITSLSDKNLLQRSFDVRGETRFNMLVTIQQYALNQLRRAGKETDARNRHLAYFLDIAEKGGKEIRGPNQLEWLHRLIAMRDNLRAALEWAIEARQTEMALHIVRNLHWFWFVHSDHSEARNWFERVLTISDASLYTESYAEVQTQLAHHIWTQIGPKGARPFVESALSIARVHNDKQNIARALSILGLVLMEEDDFVAAQLTLEESQTLFWGLHNEWEYAHTVMCLARLAYRRDELALSLSLHAQALALFREVGDRYFQSFALYYVGFLEVKQGDVKHGIVALREALVLAQQLDSKYGISGALWRFSEVAQLANNPARTIRLYWAAKNISDSIGSWREKDESDFENTMASCRAVMGAAVFAEAVEHGRAMTMEQAIAYALEDQAE